MRRSDPFGPPVARTHFIGRRAALQERYDFPDLADRSQRRHVWRRRQRHAVLGSLGRAQARDDHERDLFGADTPVRDLHRTCGSVVDESARDAGHDRFGPRVLDPIEYDDAHVPKAKDDNPWQ